MLKESSFEELSLKSLHRLLLAILYAKVVTNQSGDNTGDKGKEKISSNNLERELTKNT